MGWYTEIVSTSVLDENGNKTWDAYATSAISRGTESVAGFIQSGADWSGSVFRRCAYLLYSCIMFPYCVNTVNYNLISWFSRQNLNGDC